MTSPEHTLVGIHLAISAGSFHRYGLPVVILAAVASNRPDLDGLPMLYDMARFEVGHRVWTHNLFSIGLVSAVLAMLQYLFNWLGATSDFCAARFGTLDLPVRGKETPMPVLMVMFVAASCQALHLFCDMVVSGGDGLTDWPVCPWWPISNTGYAFPMIPWGDVGPTLVLMSGLILGARFPVQLRKISSISLAALICYLLVRQNDSI